MLRTKINGIETICMSGVDGIFYFEQQEGDKWIKKLLFDKEVSEFGLIDLDRDGQEELVVIEPFHGQTLNVYKKNEEKWELKFSDSLSFGHGLSCGVFKGEPIIMVGSRRGSFALDQFKVIDLTTGKFSRSMAASLAIVSPNSGFK